MPGERLKLHKLIRDAIASNDERTIWIYVDDSNIWINAKQLTARRKKMKTKTKRIIDFALTSGN